MEKKESVAPESLLAAPDQAPQSQITSEIEALHKEYKEKVEQGERLPNTILHFPPYRSSILRSPTKDLKLADPEKVELWSPAFGERDITSIETDLTLNGGSGEPLGERMTVTGRLLDSWGRPIPNQLIEVWQANAAGRYVHQRDQHPAPLDPNFTGAGRVITDANGYYKFTTIKPGPYPWKNHVNAWRFAYIYFLIFGSAFTQRIVTQTYFPGDPLFPLDPIYNTIRDQRDRDRLIATYDHDLT